MRVNYGNKTDIEHAKKLNINGMTEGYNISFLSKYIKRNKILLRDFALALGLKEQNEIYNYIFVAKKISAKRMEIFYKAFNVTTFDEFVDAIANDVLITKSNEKSEIKETNEIKNDDLEHERLINLLKDVSKTREDISKIEIVKESQKEEKDTDITFLYQYLLDKNILEKLINILGINRHYLIGCLEGREKLSYNYIEKICKAFKRDNLKALRKSIEAYYRNAPIEKEETKEEKIDISFAKEYILSIYKETDFYNKLQINFRFIKSCLNGESMFPLKYIDRVLKALDCTDIDELKKKVNDFNIDVQIKNQDVNQDKSIDISFAKKYIQSKITIKDLCLKTGINKVYMRLYLKGEMKISSYDFAKIINVLNINNLEELKYMVERAEKNGTTESLDLSFARDYIDSKFDVKEICEKLDMKIDTFYGYMSAGSQKISAIHLEKLFKILGVESLSQLEKEVREFSINKDGNSVDISFARDYIRTKVTIIQLADKLKVNESYINSCLKGTKRLSIKYVPKFLEILEFYSIEEFKKAVKEAEEKGLTKTFNLNFARDYIEYNFSKNMICSKLGVLKPNFECYLKGKNLLPSKYIKPLFDILEVESIEELKAKVVEFENNRDKIIKKGPPLKAVNISFAKKYVLSKMSASELAKLMNYDACSLRNSLNGEQKISIEKLGKLLEIFECDTLEELEELAKEAEEKGLTEPLNIGVAKEYIYSVTTKDKLLKGLNIDNGNLNHYINGKFLLPSKYVKPLFDTLGIESLEEFNDKVNNFYKFKLRSRKEFLEVINECELTEKEELIIKSIFEKIDDEDFSYDNVSKSINVETIEVIDVYKKCLQYYKEYLNIQNDKSLKKVLTD